MFEAGQREAPSSTAAVDPIPLGSERAGGWLFWLSAFGAFLWLAGAAALGAQALQSVEVATLPVWAVIAGAAFAALPALLLLVSGAAAREGAQARAQARRLADAAERMLSPSPRAEAAARRLGTSVRGEIAALDRCVEQAIARFRNLDDAVAAQMTSLNQAVDVAYGGAGALSDHLEEQRSALTNIGRSLAEQAQAIGDAISRHQRALAESTRAAELELQEADEALESRLTSFAAAASLIGDRTEALDSAARASAEAALRLEAALSRSLEAVTKVTGLTDAAKVSAQQAVEAAEQTARALKEATRQAIEEARRAGESLRQPQAVSAAAPAPRRSEVAAEDLGLGMRKAERAPDAQQAYEDALRFSGGEAGSRGAAVREAPIRREGARGLWRHMLAAIDDERVRGREPAAPEPERFAPETLETLDLGLAGRMLLERAGLRVEGLFTVAALEKIAHASRRGVSARRRCVREVAADAVLAYAQRLQSDPDLKRKTEALLEQETQRLNELLTRGRAPLSADATRIFLLLDAAHG